MYTRTEEWNDLWLYKKSLSEALVKLNRASNHAASAGADPQQLEKIISLLEKELGVIRVVQRNVGKAMREE